MEILFTPWRYPYLTSPKSEQPQACIFCVAAATQNPRDALTVYRNAQALVMLNRYPYTNGHVMVAPVAHEARLFDSRDASLRVHIVPRWGGDTNFMSVTARTRLVPEELDVTFDKLAPHFQTIRKDLFE